MRCITFPSDMVLNEFMDDVSSLCETVTSLYLDIFLHLFLTLCHSAIFNLIL
jgi:hypothetical protein